MFRDCTICSIGGTFCACQENPGRVKALRVWRLQKLQRQRHSSCLPEESGSSKGPRRSETAQATASVAQVAPAGKTQVE